MVILWILFLWNPAASVDYGREIQIAVHMLLWAHFETVWRSVAAESVAVETIYRIAMNPSLHQMFFPSTYKNLCCLLLDYGNQVHLRTADARLNQLLTQLLSIRSWSIHHFPSLQPRLTSFMKLRRVQTTIILTVPSKTISPQGSTSMRMNSVMSPCHNSCCLLFISCGPPWWSSVSASFFVGCRFTAISMKLILKICRMKQSCASALAVIIVFEFIRWAWVCFVTGVLSGRRVAVVSTLQWMSWLKPRWILWQFSFEKIRRLYEINVTYASEDNIC